MQKRWCSLESLGLSPDRLDDVPPGIFLLCLAVFAMRPNGTITALYAA